MTQNALANTPFHQGCKVYANQGKHKVKRMSPCKRSTPPSRGKLPANANKRCRDNGDQPHDQERTRAVNQPNTDNTQ